MSPRQPEKLVCAYCGAEKAEISFFIGASKEPDWTMWEGTGKVSCPKKECFDKARAGLLRRKEAYRSNKTPEHAMTSSQLWKGG